jgi:hypothetical protein
LFDHTRVCFKIFTFANVKDSRLDVCKSRPGKFQVVAIVDQREQLFALSIVANADDRGLGIFDYLDES